MRLLDYYWASNRDWWHWTETGHQVINDAAPEDAKESFNHYLEQNGVKPKETA